MSNAKTIRDDWYLVGPDEIRTFADLESVGGIYRFDSYQRLPVALNLYERHGPTVQVMKLLGKVWSSADNIGPHSQRLESVFLKAPAARLADFMNKKERRTLRNLPDELVVYRGTSAERGHGLSWSLCREVAERFPFYNRYLADAPVLRCGLVKKTDVVAVKLDRDEYEVILLSPPYGLTEEALIKPSALAKAA